jgi:YidC/Oxa1 family membrane protein insertase
VAGSILTLGRASRAIRAWRGLRAFAALDESFRRVVFYSEGPADWAHLGPVVEELVRARGCRIAYLTSDLADPGLHLDDDRFRALFIGFNSPRTILFRSIDCRNFVMTLPDLERFHLKRSVAPVHYVYLFHSLNSTHTSYRKGAFDAYDTILCAGPHHIEEIRRTEAVYKLPAKRLIEHGSVRLDAVSAELARRTVVTRANDQRPYVLVAPSWGDCSLLERPVGCELIDVLLRAGCRIAVRPHPMTVRRRPALLESLQRRYAEQPLLRFDLDAATADTWIEADLMISDWSGAAAEYSFSLGKPTIFIDTPQKLNNPEWARLGLRGFEDSIRAELGVVVAEKAIDTLPTVIEACRSDRNGMRRRIAAAAAKRVFNIGRSAAVAADYLAGLYRAAPEACQPDAVLT